MNNKLYIFWKLRTRTRNARTRANADVIQALRLVVTCRDGQTMRTSSRTFIPSVSFCGLTYVYHKSALKCEIKCLRELQNPCQTIRKK